MNRFRSFFYGRYGIDQLSMAIFVLGLAFWLVARLFFPLLSLGYYLCLAVCFYRALSRNIYKRSRENGRYLDAVRSVSSGCRLRMQMLRNIRTHKYIKCPRCKQWMRVPKGKGKISIDCPKCGKIIIKKV